MAGGKLTPRQKMINMMYLVLTALLAMNVSKEVLNAFTLVNAGLQTSNRSLVDKNNIIYNQFAKQAETQEKAKPLYAKALEAKKIAKEIYDDIEEYKKDLIQKAGGVVDGEIVQRDNIDIGTHLFVENGGKAGRELYSKLANARKQFMAVNKGVVIPLNPDDVMKGKSKELTSKGWEYATFNHVPVTAAVTILSKFQNDVIASEGIVIENLFKSINENDFKFDQLTAAVIAPSSYVMQGGKYTAQIFVAASSKDQDPEVFIGGIPAGAKKTEVGYEPIESKDGNVSGTKLEVKDGKGIYEAAASAVGEKKYGGVIRVKNPNGDGFKLYPFEAGFQVGAKSVVVSPTQMNVLYIGVDNPIKISAAGVQSQDVSASISAGSLTKGANGEFIAKVSTVGKVTINVSAKIDGKVQSMGSEEFRVKRIPDPVPTLGGKLRGGNANAALIKAQSGVVPLLENFDFQARFNVQSFKMIYSSKGDVLSADASGPMLSAQMQGFLSRAKPKDIIIIDDIKVVGPDGQSRKLSQVAFTII